jgi:hypothetical protein
VIFSEHQYISCVHWSRILYMEWHLIQYQNISISHMYFETEYCTWSDIWYSFRTSVYLTWILNQNIVHGVTCDSFRTSVYLTCILKQNIVHGVTCDTVSEYQYISNVYWNKALQRSVFSFHKQLLKWMVLPVVVTVQCHQYHLPVWHLNINTRMNQNVSVSQMHDFVYQVYVEEKWIHFRLTSLTVWILINY